MVGRRRVYGMGGRGVVVWGEVRGVGMGGGEGRGCVWICLTKLITAINYLSYHVLYCERKSYSSTVHTYLYY